MTAACSFLAAGWNRYVRGLSANVVYQVHGAETVEEIGNAHEIACHQRYAQSAAHKVVHLLHRDFLLEETGTIGTIGKQRHIFRSDYTGQFQFLNLSDICRLECHMIGMFVNSAFGIDKNYHLIYVRDFQGRLGEEPFYKIGSFLKEDADSSQCLAVDIVACSIFLIGIMMAVEELQSEYPRCHYACGYIVLILSVRFQQQLAQVVQSCITIYGPGGKLSCKKKE